MTSSGCFFICLLSIVSYLFDSYLFVCVFVCFFLLLRRHANPNGEGEEEGGQGQEGRLAICSYGNGVRLSLEAQRSCYK